MGLRLAMPHYIAIVEEEGPDTAIGIWFPDLPGCFSAGDDLDDALRNAEEALAFWAESEQEEGRPIPAPRSLTELRKDPQAAEDLRQYMVAVIPLRRRVAHAAE
jgi:predicted RNase H-like HicB family nuclease